MYVHITDTATTTASAIRGIAIGSTEWRTASHGVAPRSVALIQYVLGTAWIASRTIGIRNTTAPRKRNAIFIPSAIPSHITRIGSSATIGADRKGSTSGDITAFSTGEAPISTPIGTPMITTSTPATRTRIVDQSVAWSSRLSPRSGSHASRRNAVTTSHGAGSFAFATSEKPASADQTISTASTPLMPAMRWVFGAIGAYGFHMIYDREITASRVERFISRQASRSTPSSSGFCSLQSGSLGPL